MSDLFDAAAERIAFDGDRPKSQVLTELRHGAGEMPRDGLFVIEGERFDVIVDVRRRPHLGAEVVE